MAIMEQKEHIATLCAAGTVGIAAAGFALGAEEVNAFHITPGKRKWPGASSAKSPGATQAPFVGRRSVSQPVPVVNSPPEQSPATFTASLFRKRTLHELRPNTAQFSDTTVESRASSLNRGGTLRPRTADTRSTSERRDTSTGSSWLKRISTVSSSYGSSPAGSIRHQDGAIKQNLSQSVHNGFPNKLVKRSTSQRALSNDQASGTFLRRPATSHQRTATLKEWNLGRNVGTTFTKPAVQPNDLAMESESLPIWRPFFERGYPRKRHSTGGTRDAPSLRTISTPNRGRPILVLGRSVEASESPSDFTQQSAPSPVIAQSEPSSRQRLRRSLSSMHRASRRRFVTDPVVKVNNEAVNGTMSSAATQSPLSPVSNISAFDVDLPNGSPVFTSSPTTFMPVKHRFSFRKRESNALSDPTTISSDNDTRVFTDDDSMDFQSDTAFDSLTTRATVSSHSAMQPPKLETIFNDAYQPQIYNQTTILEDLMEKTSLNNSRSLALSRGAGTDQNTGIGISGLDDIDMEMDTSVESAVSRTPVQAMPVYTDEFLATPVATKPVSASNGTKQSPTLVNGLSSVRQMNEMPQATPKFEDDIDWSPLSDVSEKASTRGGPSDTAHALSLVCSSPVLPQRNQEVSFDDQVHEDKRTSIFDWSEQQRASGDLTNGGEARPKTVHGKQTHDNSRSRSSGRKGPSQLHLRSQSVPTNRDSNAESTPMSTSKFSTWGLGHKPVSEEWSDDFEFDDLEEEPAEILQLAIPTADVGPRGSVRGVKVPQSIIDRQASVHIQFGQVQEFMLLVEELKRLRTRGSTLNLLESHSQQLWEDAESIINLATINDEEDDLENDPPHSPSAFDVFGDESLLASRTGASPGMLDDSRRHSTAQRSFSSPATPPCGRPRGESLAQAKTFLQTIHQNRNNNEPSSLPDNNQPSKKLPFDTQDLKDLVAKSSIITRALKEIIRKAEGVSISPTKTPPRTRDPAFSQIFDAPDVSPCPPFRHPRLPHSRSANAYLNTTLENNDNTGDIRLSFTTFAAMV